MTVSVATNSISHTGNGVTTVFSYDFLIPTGTSVVTLTTIATGLESAALTEGVDYSITGEDNPAGGTITYPLSGSELASTHKINIKRILEPTQDLDLTSQSGYNPEALENQLDKIVMILGQHDEQLDRSVKIGTGASSNPEDLISTLLAAVDDAEASAAAAATSETNAGNSETASAASETKAQEWAENAEDDPVEPGLFSAKHWAAKAEAALSAVDPVEDQIASASATAFLDSDELPARKNSNGSLIKYSWANIKSALTTVFNALYPALTLLTTRGDMIYRDATTWARLPKGTSGQVLTMGANDPAWATAAAGGSWEYIGSITTTSGSSQALTGISTDYKNLLLLFDFVGHNTTATIRVALSSNNGSSYGTAWVISNSFNSGSFGHSGQVFIMRSGENGQSKIIAGDPRSNNTVSTYLETVITGLINAVQISPSAGAFDSGVVYVFGQK